MSEGDDGSRRQAGRSTGDVLEQGNSRPILRWPLTVRPGRVPTIALVLGVAGLLIGLAAGYTAGGRNTGKGAAPAAQASSTANQAVISAEAGGFPLAQSGALCSAQTGSKLELGIQVTNLSSAPADLSRVRAVLPMGGLQVIAQTWGPCGELPIPDSPVPGTDVTPGGSTWFSVTFRVLVRCPAPVPVQFALDYIQHGRPGTVRLPGFADLSQVPYTGCS